MTPKKRQALTAKPLIMIVVAAVIVMMTSASVASMASAQQMQTSGSKFGTIASLQNGKNGKPEWIVSGGWEFKNINSSSPAFNATFNMVMLNGNAPHKHTITDFKMTGSPTKTGIATTYNGTATISLKKGPVSDVPISIKLMGPRAMSLWIDPTKTEGHFGDTPIYGVQHGMPMQMMSMK
ncbi:MAG: hypothetical protein WAK17_19465 [Candidatus Nitrosopolaris sp.]|jgi:hypothetical protein